MATSLTLDTTSNPPRLVGTQQADQIVLTPTTQTSVIGVWLLGGDDSLVGTNGPDLVYGGAGNDILRLNDGNDTAWGGKGDDDIAGFSGNDLLYGGAGADFISGEDGNDTLLGGKGKDQLFGGLGNDYLKGDQGVDSLTGGLGNDTFVLDRGDLTGNVNLSDIILDFNDNTENDKIAIPKTFTLDPSSFTPTIDNNGDGVPDFILKLQGTQQILGVVVANSNIRENRLTLTDNFITF